MLLSAALASHVTLYDDSVTDYKIFPDFRHAQAFRRAFGNNSLMKRAVLDAVMKMQTCLGLSVDICIDSLNGLIRDTLYLVGSPVLLQAEAAEEVKGFDTAIEAVKNSETPEFFPILGMK